MAATIETTTMREPVHFNQVNVGDRLTFTTRDNGFGGSGDYVERTGTVTRKTGKVVDLHVGGGVHVFERGKNRVLGATARLRKTDWYDRNVTRVGRAERLPYDAAHALYVDHGHTVEVLWTPDHEQAKNPEAIDLLDRANVAVEVVARMSRYRKSEGAPYSGWIIDQGVRGGHLEPIPNKRDAMKQLRMIVAEYFQH